MYLAIFVLLFVVILYVKSPKLAVAQRNTESGWYVTDGKNNWLPGRYDELGNEMTYDEVKNV